MSLQIRRGTDAERQGIVFDDGEIVYATDTGTVWVGDGVTAGGIQFGLTETLADLSDVDVPAPTDGQLLTWVNANSKWEAVDGASGSPLTTKGDLHVYDTTDNRLAAGTDGQILTADSVSGAGVKWADLPAGENWALITVNTSVVAGINYAVDTTGPVTLTLPVSPALNDVVSVSDATGNAGTNNVTVNGNGKNVIGDTTLTLDINWSAATIVFINATIGWIFKSVAN